MYVDGAATGRAAHPPPNLGKEALMSFGRSLRTKVEALLLTQQLQIVYLAAVLALTAVAPVSAGPLQSYLALGDSLAFGQTTPPVQPSFGDQGYVKPYADWLGTMNGGVRPQVINLAIPGETSASFFTGVNPPGGTRNAAVNENYSVPPVSQDSLMLKRIALEQAAGHRISHVSFALGSNDFLVLASSPAFASATQTQRSLMVGKAFTTLQANYTHVLAQLRSLLPSAMILLLDYYNPYAVDPSNPFAKLYTAIALAHEQLVQMEAQAFHARVVDIYQPFVGHEAQYTHILDGNVHPNATGYGVIADQMLKASQTPEPASLALFGIGGLGIAGVLWRRRVAA
jgi:lysophospholipase L1-like esterase